MVSWRAYSEWPVTKRETAVRARDAALQNWQRVYGLNQGSGVTAADEVKAREVYFDRRAALEDIDNKAR